MGSIGNRSITFTLHEGIKHKDGMSVCSHLLMSVRWSWHCQEMELGVVDPVGVQREQEQKEPLPKASCVPKYSWLGTGPFPICPMSNYNQRTAYYMWHLRPPNNVLFMSSVS